ncbi:MAG: hypothetical protein ACREH8_24550, partial [Opitutaceae bacterium]
MATTTLIWLGIMFATKPEPPEKLAAFFRQVRPYGFWRPVAQRCLECRITDDFRHDLGLYVLAVGSSLGLLFGMGLLLLGRPAFAAVATRSFRRTWFPCVST